MSLPNHLEQLPGPLSGAEVRAFFDEGLIVLPALFDALEVAAMRRAFKRLEEAAAGLDRTGHYRGSLFVLGERADGTGEGGQIQRVVWCAAAEPVLSKLGMDPRLTRVAAQLLGSRRMHQLISQAHFKFPGDGVDFPWHQDSRHRRYGTELWRDVNGLGSFVETLTAIDPMTRDNGPLAYIPGTCRLGHLHTEPPEHQLPEGSVDPSEARLVQLEPGDVAVFGPYLVHGSGPNTGPSPRRSFLNGFAHPDANSRVYPGEGAGRELEAPL